MAKSMLRQAINVLVKPHLRECTHNIFDSSGPKAAQAASVARLAGDPSLRSDDTYLSARPSLTTVKL
jgi:hypothetical protein